MRDLESPKWMYLKCLLFCVIGVTAAGLIVAGNPNMQTAVLLALVIWSFCRVYCFAFYVIEKYIDPNFKFSGLAAALRHLARRQ